MMDWIYLPPARDACGIPHSPLPLRSACSLQYDAPGGARFPPVPDDFAFVALLWFGVDLHADRVSRGGSAQAKVGLLCSNPVSCADVPGVLEQQVSQPGPRFDTSAPFPDVLAEKRRQLAVGVSLNPLKMGVDAARTPLLSHVSRLKATPQRSRAHHGTSTDAG
ncbi:hypothetical protein Q9233_014720 [Columba guinea]|nr:hypothetical protein Q9233_014720 [Columba guinea]